MSGDLQKRIAGLAKAAKRANSDKGFKYLQLCQPVLIIGIINLLRQGGVPEINPGEYNRIEILAKAASGKRMITDEALAFIDACEPKLVESWCELAGNLTAQQLA